jgi:hypothetical protein
VVTAIVVSNHARAKRVRVSCVRKRWQQESLCGAGTWQVADDCTG